MRNITRGMIVAFALSGLGWGCSSSSDTAQLTSDKDGGSNAMMPGQDAGGEFTGDDDGGLIFLDAGTALPTDGGGSSPSDASTGGGDASSGAFNHHAWSTLDLMAGKEGTQGSLVDGTGSAAEFEFDHSVPYGCGLVAIGNTLYVADVGAGHFRMIDRTTNAVTTLQTTGASMAGRVGLPMQVATDGKDLYFVAGGSGHWNEYSVAKIALSGGNVGDAGVELTTLAGSTNNTAGTANGSGTAAGFGMLWGIVYDGGVLYVSDTTSIRKVTLDGVVTTLASNVKNPGPLAADHKGHLYFAADSAQAIVGDGNDVLRTTINELDIASGTVTTLAGTAGQSGAKDGTGSAARFNGPTGVAIDDKGNLYVADQSNGAIRLVVVNGTNSVVTTVVGALGSSPSTETFNLVKTGSLSSARLDRPAGLLLTPDDGNLVIVDRTDEVVLVAK